MCSKISSRVKGTVGQKVAIIIFGFLRGSIKICTYFMYILPCLSQLLRGGYKVILLREIIRKEQNEKTGKYKKVK